MKIYGKLGKVLIAVLVLSLILFTRFYNLDNTGVFFWDQSADLVKIHQYYQERIITMVGPISEDNTKVFGSLTYYMLMPFAIIGRFDPLSTAMGAAFWGSMMALLILLITKILNRKMLLYISLLVIIWFPLIEISRSAWNPYFMPFWIVLGLVLYQYKKPLSLFLSGMSLGLTTHNHYVSLFATGSFILITTLLAIKFKKIYLNSLMIIGFIISIIPFVIFDLRHPPGLFSSKILYFNHVKINLSIIDVLTKTFHDFQSVLYYYTHAKIFLFFLGVFIILLFINDLRKKKLALIYVLPFLFQIIAISFISDSFTHYFLPGLIFFLAWIIYPRSFKGELLSKLCLIILIITSLFTIIPQLITPTWSPSIASVREITNYIASYIRKDNLKNVNLATLTSVDSQTYGGRYRDLLLIKNTALRSKYEYFVSDHLFVVSQSSEDRVRNDPAPEMFKFKSGRLRMKWEISDKIWKVYLFDRI